MLWVPSPGDFLECLCLDVKEEDVVNYDKHNTHRWMDDGAQMMTNEKRGICQLIFNGTKVSVRVHISLCSLDALLYSDV